VVASDWAPRLDRASGRTCYVNRKTQAKRWTLPDDDEVDSFIAELLNHRSGDSGGGGGGGAVRTSSGRGGGSDSSDPELGVTEQLPPTFSDETSDAAFDDADDAVLSVDELFDAVDIDHSGHISFEEFETFWQQRLRTIGDGIDDGKLAQARSLFTDLDEDGSGLLDREEFRVIMAEVVAYDWTPRLDRASGRTFYVNHKTQAKRWTLPDDDEVDSFIAELLNHRSGDSGGGGAVRTSSGRGGGSDSSDPELHQRSQFEQGAQMVVAAQSIVVRKAHKKGSAHVVELKQVRTTRENAERPICFDKPIQ
jgi:hypothetical protein